jgi:iron complex outermembrane recepter protein
MKQYLLLILSLFAAITYAQNTTISGSVIDASTGESLIGASIVYGKGMGVAANYDGNFIFSVPSGDRKITVSYVGYQQQSKSIKAEGRSVTVKFKLKPMQLSEVHIVADVARDRETPVAFTTVSLKKVNEELASQDIPMILNSTPGVYATQSGGGDGDARITIRGFNQRNVAVMIDGIPVNDMENGRVYWSNWSGLDAVTSNIQVQRGLGASKIAIPSVGGTMNILTKGIGNKQSGTIKQDIGSFGRLKTSIGYNSGKMDNGWGFTLAGSYKRGNGFVDETWSEGFFYYAKIQKELGNHILGLSAMGAPQKHGQRSYESDIATYDTTFARSLGDTSDFSGMIVNKGIQYNKHWGYLDRWTINSSGDTIHANETLNTKQNYYHKPQFSLRDFWTVNDKFYVSNILYVSIGNGGGTTPLDPRSPDKEYNRDGQYSLQEVYNTNVNKITPYYSTTENSAETYLRSSINNHYWYGGLSTLNYQVSDEISLSGGLDMRYYKGQHYQEVYDLLGADYVADNDYTKGASQIQMTEVKRIGDKVGKDYEGIVKWRGMFSQAEYSNGMFSAFFNISASNSAYKKIDYFKKKDLVLVDTTLLQVLGTSQNTEMQYDENDSLIGAHKTMVADTFWYNGNPYTINSPEARFSESDWKWIRGYTIKTGANVNLDEYNNIFFNVGFISKAPLFKNVFEKYDVSYLKEIKNEKVKAVELGYSYRSSLFSANVNTYYTVWENKPVDNAIKIENDDGDVIYANINGMHALHKGIEMDFVYKFIHNLSLEGLFSLGDWRWNSANKVWFFNENNQPILEDGEHANREFDAIGVHVGDAAQTQYGLSLRYEPTYASYIKLRGTYFNNYYADFDPLSLNGENAGRESWKIPAYQLIDLHAGYKISITPKNKLDIKISVLNLLNEIYISDAQNNDPYNANYQDFDAKSAGVFFGLGRRFNISAKINF